MRDLGLLLVALALSVVPSTASAQVSLKLDRKNVATVNIVDVGQGDAILIRSPEGKTALIDAGPSHEIVTKLRGLGATSIDIVVVSHHQADHYGGMEAVIRGYHPRVFLATDSSHTTPAYLRLLERVRDDNIRAIFPTAASQKIELGSVPLTVLPQPPENDKDENDNSIGIRVQYGSFSALLTGDSEGGERNFWERNCPESVRNCDVLKLAHDGSRNGRDIRWLEIVSPKLTVASLGASYEFGHPHAQTVALLERRDVPLLRTDQDGTITIASDGEKWEVVGHRGHVRGPSAKGTDDRRIKRAGRNGAHLAHAINVNTATQEELESLPGIGPALARRIVEGRPYRSVDDLRRIKGIGEKKWEEIRPLVRAR